jgi:hypothetical protein
MSAADHRTFNALPEQLSVFRGYAKGRNRSGMSLTLSLAVAERFSVYAVSDRRAFVCEHHGDLGAVVAGVCLKRDVLAYFDDGGSDEQEIAIRPSNVSRKRNLVR